MRIVKRVIDKSGNGFVVIIPKDEEDLWHVYNLVAVGDAIKAGTFRKIQLESKTGSIKSEKKFVVLKMRITGINYWGDEHLEINITGRNLEQNRFLAVGQHHTMRVELEHPLTIYKSNWDSMHFQILKRSEIAAKTSEVAAIVMEEGLAYLCFVKATTTLVKAKIEKNVPKKLSGVFHYEKAIMSFYEQCYQAILKFIDFAAIKCFIIASPGLVKDDFLNYMMKQGEKMEGGGVIKANREKILLSKASSGFKSALNEVFSDPAVVARIKDTSAVRDVAILETFFKTLKQDSDKVAYGPKYVLEANKNKAIQDLLITDGLFNTRKLGLRKQYIKLTEDVRNNGGEVHIFSSAHISGEKLTDMSGMAAILRFPLNLDYLDEQEETTTDESEEEAKFDDNMSMMTDDLDEDFFRGLVLEEKPKKEGGKSKPSKTKEEDNEDDDDDS